MPPSSTRTSCSAGVHQEARHLERSFTLRAGVAQYVMTRVAVGDDRAAPVSESSSARGTCVSGKGASDRAADMAVLELLDRPAVHEHDAGSTGEGARLFRADEADRGLAGQRWFRGVTCGDPGLGFGRRGEVRHAAREPEHQCAQDGDCAKSQCLRRNRH